MNLLAIAGTTAKKSYNRNLLKYMQGHFSNQAHIELAEIAEIPLFSEDLANETEPAQVTKIVERVESADGIIFGVPEYDHAVTAALKSTLEWLSFKHHSLQNKPVMIVGTSLGIQGTSRAQDNLRVILNSPGVNAQVLTGNEFMMSFAGQAFDDYGNLNDTKTITFLEQCFAHFNQLVRQSLLTNKDKTDWQAIYDVVVLGFGGAGATAARFAADKGAHVLLVDAAPYGHEGGNTRYAAQYVATGNDFKKLVTYYRQLFSPLKVPEKPLRAYLKGMTTIPTYIQKYLDVTPVSWNKEMKAASDTRESPMVEYPEFAGSNTFDITLVNHQGHDAGLWKLLREQVLKRKDQIDVWLDSRAQSLIQDPISRVIEGVTIKRKNHNFNVFARNGVVLALGGFENNPEMIQNYFKYEKLTPIGTLYNRGDGIRLAQAVGAKMWHMANYESHGILPGLTFAEKPGQRGRQIRGWRELNHGSVFVIADDGTRYFDETAESRHGHIYSHGRWEIPMYNEHPYLVFDAAQYARFKASAVNGSPYPDFFKKLIIGNTLENLSDQLGLPKGQLKKTVDEFNQNALQKHNDSLGRSAKTMAVFDQGPFYAIALANDVLNTQGGPERNEHAEILDVNNQVIPHLYGAGELGGICGNRYQGGGNLAECLIFGKIAGESAATDKQNTRIKTLRNPVGKINDLVKESNPQKVNLGSNQYLGKSKAGIGGQVTVKVTYTDHQIKAVQIVQ